MRFSRLVALAFAASLLCMAGGFSSSLHADPVKKKKKPKVKDPSKTAAPVVDEKPLRNANFNFNTATEGKVEDFAQGETLDQIRERFHADMIKKYSKDGSGNFTQQAQTEMLQDYNAKQMLLVQHYDWKEHDDLDADKIHYMENVLYQKRLIFMKSFDADKDGYLNPAETAAMRAELQRRRDKFVEDFDR
jgi:hypothetical protein